MASHARVDDGPDPVAELRLAAWRQAAAGDAHGAAATYDAALALAPGDAALLTTAADARRFTGDLDAAIALFGRALAIDPRLVAAWYGRALTHEAVGDDAAARDDFARTMALSPATAPGFAGFAAAAARLGEVDAARAAARTALRLSAGDATTNIVLARCELARGRPGLAAQRIEELLARRGGAGSDAVVALGVLGDAYDRLGRVDAAFAAYASAKARLAAASGTAAPVARWQVEALTAAVVARPPVATPRPVPPVAGEAARHVFLLGFPRSGTTLVEQVLASADGVTTLEEAPTLAAAVPYLADLPGLAALDDATVARLRADYWTRVAAAGAGGGGAAWTFVDMDPFKAPALPLIARLFPDATVVHVRRDPRDVVWSCFRRSFVAGPVAAEFATLPRAARHYAATMRLIAACRTAFPLAWHDLCYDDLVDDFDGVTQGLCAAAGVPWSPRLRDFAATARARRVRTASAAQVRTPLFDGRGQWRRYAQYLTEAEAILAEWV